MKTTNKSSRREFLKTGAMAASAIMAGGATGLSDASKRIGYISPEIPKVTFPPLKGDWQELLVPDTLDLAERAKFSINTLTNSADPEAGYEIWWHVLLNRKPPVMVHDFHDLNIQYKFQEALPLLRDMTGSQMNTTVDQAWVENLLRMQGEDGLIYMPFEGRPWAGFHADWLQQKGLSETQLASLVAQGGWMGTFGLYYLLSQEAVWKQRVEKLIDRMAQLMVYKDDYCYFPVMAVNPGARISQDIVDHKCNGEASGAAAGWLIQGLCQAYLATRYEPALSLAAKLSVYLMKHSGCYDDQGRFKGVPHTHLHTRPISGLLQYAISANSRSLMEYCRKSYEYTKTSSGSATVGFFPSTPGVEQHYSVKTVQQVFKHGVEGCTVADMVALAIKLTRTGIGDYWDDADRYLRNQFAEMQLLKPDFASRATVEEPYKTWNRPDLETANRALERNIGACMSIASPNDFVGHPLKFEDRPVYDHLFLMHCCTGNHARAIWYAWDNILDLEDGTLKINLLLNRTSPWADVHSYIPYQGQVDVRVKSPVRLSVRIPEWVTPGQTACQVNDQKREVGWQGRYAQVGGVKPGDAVTLTFPISERTVQETLYGTEYTMTIKGNSVVAMDPPGRYYPFYQRAHYRENEVRWVKRKQFVSARPSLHWPY